MKIVQCVKCYCSNKDTQCQGTKLTLDKSNFLVYILVMEITKELLEKMLHELHLTPQEIGKKLGMSRQGVWWHMKKHGVHSSGTRFTTTCDFCGQDFKIYRSRWRLSERHFCSNQCKGGYLKSETHTMELIRKKTAKNSLLRVGRELKIGEYIVQDGTNIRIYPDKVSYLTEKRENSANMTIEEARNA